MSAIKVEPPVEFLCILPTYHENRTLLGETKVKTDVKVKDFERLKSECRQALKKRVDKTSDLKVHSQKRQHFQYKLCNQKFRKQQIYESHMKLHNGSNALNCKICSRNFLKRFALKKLFLSDHLRERP